MPSWNEPALADVDPDIARLIREEQRRDGGTIRLIARLQSTAEVTAEP